MRINAINAMQINTINANQRMETNVTQCKCNIICKL